MSWMEKEPRFKLRLGLCISSAVLLLIVVPVFWFGGAIRTALGYIIFLLIIFFGNLPFCISYWRKQKKQDHKNART
jgi:hypothetical protein